MWKFNYHLFFCNRCILPSFYGIQNGWSTMQYPKLQESTTYRNIIQSQRDQCWNWTLINEMAKCRGPMYYKCPCWPDSVQVLTKQKMPKVFWDALKMFFFFQIAALLTGVFSSATLLLEGSMLNYPSLLNHRRLQFKKRLSSFLEHPSQQTFRPSLFQGFSSKLKLYLSFRLKINRNTGRNRK